MGLLGAGIAVLTGLGAGIGIGIATNGALNAIARQPKNQEISTRHCCLDVHLQSQQQSMVWS